MKNYTRLSGLPLGCTAVIINIDKNSRIANRLGDFGVYSGAKISAEFCAPFGDPVAYRVGNTLFALRKEDGDRIIIDQNGGQP